MDAEGLGHDHTVDPALLSSQDTNYGQQGDMTSYLNMNSSTFLPDPLWADIDAYLPLPPDHLPEPGFETWECSSNGIPFPPGFHIKGPITSIGSSSLAHDATDIAHSRFSALPENVDSTSHPIAAAKMRSRASIPRNSRRQRISSAARESLNAEFKRNPYPSNTDLSNFARTLDLPAKTIKIWFSNARARRDPNVAKISRLPHRQGIDVGKEPGNSALEPTESESPPCFLPSPTPSNLSMERYLSSPQQEEVASPEAIEANIEAAENEKPISTQEFTWESGFNAMQDIDDTSRDTIDKKVLPPLQRQRRRASLTRAKDDCLTCKRLYKECDRQRTDCSQCIKIGKECSGYYPESTGVSLPVSASTPIDTAIPKYTPPISPFCGVLRLAGFTDDNPPIIPSPSTWDAESSAGSIGSDASYGSMDSRGSRRGRRRWKNPYPSKPKASEARSPKVEYHCTFPGCGKSFIYRSEWDRHESSIHYPQDVWICCNTMDIFSFLEMSIQPEEANVGNPQVLESQNLRQIFSQCIVKNETNRSFYRKDQFIQHLRQCHLKQSSAIKENEARRLWEILTATWMRKVTYASWEAAGLHCSLCDVSFDTWAGRKQHFARHFMDGVFIWNDEQTAQKMGSIFSPKLLLDKPYSQFPYRCPACDLTFISESAAMVQHKQCSAWSCAFPNSLKEAVWPKSLLRPHDFGHDAQQTGSKPADQQIDCVLCGLTFEGIWDDIEEQMHLHLNFHGLPCHDKTVYSFSEFTDHMRGHHRLDMFSKSFNMHTLDPWNREIRSSYSYSSVHNWGS